MTPPVPTSDGGATSGQAGKGPALTVAAAARRLGVAPATLRTWDRRYGLGPSGRSAGSHRRYTGDDVARLLVMRGLTIEGVAPVDAAQAALEADVSSIDPWGEVPYLGAGGPRSEEVDSELRDGASGSGGPDGAEGGPDVAGEQADEPPARDRGVAPRRPMLRAVQGGAGARPGARAGGTGAEPSARASVPDRDLSRTLRAPDAASVSDVVDAAIAYDERACEELLRIGPDDDPGVWWPILVEPAFRRLRERTVLAGPGEDPAVLLANATLHALRRSSREREAVAVAAGAPPANHPSRMRKIVLIFAAPEERLPLAAHALAAALAARGGTARIVTGPANTHRSLEIVAMVRPAAVVAVSSLPRPELDVVDATHEANPDLPIFVGMSHDSAEVDIPLAANVLRVRSFTGLLHEVLAIAR